MFKDRANDLRRFFKICCESELKRDLNKYSVEDFIGLLNLYLVSDTMFETKDKTINGIIFENKRVLSSYIFNDLSMYKNCREVDLEKVIKDMEEQIYG